MGRTGSATWPNNCRWFHPTTSSPASNKPSNEFCRCFHCQAVMPGRERPWRPRTGSNMSNKLLMMPVDPVKSAKLVGLRYVSDEMPGIRRENAGEEFRYIDARGGVIEDAGILGRIKSLAIPPAWTEVWICPAEDGHLQATGRDARRRKQHRYHPRWREVRDETKYAQMIAFAE